MGHRIETLREIRSANVGAECGAAASEQGITDIVHEMGRVQSLPQRFQRMIRRYVNDMNGVMTEIARVVVPKGQAVMVIGDCTLRGTYIRNSAAIRLLAASHCLELVSERRRRIPDKRRYLPPPKLESGDALAKRLRTEVILSFRK
jgi:hypothetical protein